MYFDIQGQKLVDCDEDGDQTGTENDAGVDIVELVVPKGNTEEKKEVERSYHLFQQKLVPCRPIYFYGSFAVAILQRVNLLPIQSCLMFRRSYSFDS